ncbi:MAG: hypothetical protein AAGG68_14225 [Bacteroidota bacterium]
MSSASKLPELEKPILLGYLLLVKLNEIDLELGILEMEKVRNSKNCS